MNKIVIDYENSKIMNLFEKTKYKILKLAIHFYFCRYISLHFETGVTGYILKRV